jgi:hypothetical protein
VLQEDLLMVLVEAQTLLSHLSSATGTYTAQLVNARLHSLLDLDLHVTPSLIVKLVLLALVETVLNQATENHALSLDKTVILVMPVFARVPTLVTLENAKLQLLTQALSTKSRL